eukprot:CAMPEP_0172674526 /NCGR_PEP_ID=MMETSP1074-20121228/12781_1 /TAXON_ID=2916 /ORGANISM="Ceratium fusus, Strain PA161109" /LENGTH=92 /DNA_ID=CAMNT_0013491937 /DNA_START=509 /DNA_END=784 /DNA_ORIENTATION=+
MARYLHCLLAEAVNTLKRISLVLLLLLLPLLRLLLVLATSIRKVTLEISGGSIAAGTWRLATAYMYALGRLPSPCSAALSWLELRNGGIVNL